jgi:lipid-A-disaccharide synthase
MWVARKILKFNIPFVSPPNIVMQREIVPELLQEAATADRIAQESLQILLNPEHRQTIWDDYQQLRAALGDVGVCDRAAEEILEFAHNRTKNKAG